MRTNVTNILGTIVILSAIVSSSRAMADDRSDIQALRANLEQAILNNNPGPIANLITDDFVYIQNNWEGPTTYGKKAFTDYWPTMEQATSAEVRLIKPATIHGNWAFEEGETFMTIIIGGEERDRVARFLRILHKGKDGWKYAREHTATAEDLGMRKAPPLPGESSNAGRGTWEAMESPDPNDELAATIERCTLNVVAERDPYKTPLKCMWKHDDDFTVITDAGMITWADYVAWRESEAKTPYDELHKYNPEVIADGDFGYMWGHSIATGIHIDTGHRWGAVGVSTYIFRKDDSGTWRLFTGFNTGIMRDKD